jgi:hypothetical protein
MRRDERERAQNSERRKEKERERRINSYFNEKLLHTA